MNTNDTNNLTGTGMTRWALGELLGALPERRDWLNPDAEKVLRAALAPAAVSVNQASLRECVFSTVNVMAALPPPRTEAITNLLMAHVASHYPEPNPATGETDREVALRFKREADALWKRLNAAELEAGRYRVWRDHMLTVDQAFIARMEAALPPDVGANRPPTAAEWDTAIDKASGMTYAAPEADDAAAQAKLYRDFTALAEELGFDGLPAALDALRGPHAALKTRIDALPTLGWFEIANGMVGKYRDDAGTRYVKLDDVRGLTGSVE